MNQNDNNWIELTDEDRTRAFESLPDMLDGFLKTWGWLHFAKAIEDICREKNERTAKADLEQWAAQVEASGEAEKHAGPQTHLGAVLEKTRAEAIDSGMPLLPMQEICRDERAEALDPYALVCEVARYKALYEKSQELFARERGVTKEQGKRIDELAAVLKDVAWRIDDIRDMLMKRNGRDEAIYGCDEWSTPTVNLATAHKVIDAALSKVDKS